VLVLRGLSTTTSRLSTTTSFARLRRGRGDDGAARLRLASVLVVVVRWYMNLDIIFIISGVRYTIMIEDE
jgi:hypothetical protein